MNGYIERLKAAIRDFHGVKAMHLGTDRVTETFQGEVVWEREVEVFGIMSHPKAKICFAWSYQNGNMEQFATILGAHPVKSSKDAVRAHIASQPAQAVQLRDSATGVRGAR